ncbi:stage III sporulation protein AD [Anaerosporobacter mobilis DSM 15930]|jgi:stage III sporulation protein AD|uniref:Stage III sporulation protein AD n=2 Tax=Anaerosporobacter TaxID=653683 RepID=A0A1M7M2K5_9FIRM|nr:stage III sporulation AC/AD family protein [Anaerosporobacter mobilis]MBS5931654.1 stage III sporulation AC/AD family protein [Clostridiales bacterium]SHM84887.1 stage III sporulation protein AD [Anaerosporobacter mobilis DSM 15930]
MIKAAIIGIVGVLIAIQFKGGKSEYGMYIAAAVCIIITALGITRLEIIIDTINRIQGYLSINKTYFNILFRIIGITYISEFASSLCKDAGHAAIAGQIELVGKLSILTVSMPILLALLDTINEFLA